MNNITKNKQGLIGVLAVIITIVVGGGTLFLGTGAISNVHKSKCGSGYNRFMSGASIAELGDLPDASNEQNFNDVMKCKEGITDAVKASGPVASLISVANSVGGDEGIAYTALLDREMDLVDKLADPDNKEPFISAVLPPDVLAKLKEKDKTPPADTTPEEEEVIEEEPYVFEPLATGKVTSLNTGFEIDGATVKLSDSSGKVISTDKTGFSGRYTLDPMKAGTYKLTISSEDYDSMDFNITVGTNNVSAKNSDTGKSAFSKTFKSDEALFANVNAALEGAKITLTGEVIDSVEGMGISGAGLGYGKDGAPDYMALAKTDSGGNFSIEVFKDSDEYKLVTTAKGYNRYTLGRVDLFNGIIKLDPTEKVVEEEIITGSGVFAGIYNVSFSRPSSQTFSEGDMSVTISETTSGNITITVNESGDATCSITMNSTLLTSAGGQEIPGSASGKTTTCSGGVKESGVFNLTGTIKGTVTTLWQSKTEESPITTNGIIKDGSISGNINMVGNVPIPFGK